MVIAYKVLYTESYNKKFHVILSIISYCKEPTGLTDDDKTKTLPNYY